MRAAALTVALGTLLLLTAGTFDAEPLYVPGAAFTLLGLLALGWVGLGSLGVRVEREVAAHTVEEDQAVEVRVRVRAGVTALLTGRLEEDLLDAPVRLETGRRGMRLLITVRFARRGRRVLAPVRLVVADPLGLASRTLPGGEAAELLVLPRVWPVQAPDGAARGGVLAARAGRPRMAAEAELDGLRPHRPGAPASRIHWSVFARTDELWERKLTADADARPLVVLDPRATGARDPQDALDAAVRAAASLVVALARDGGCSVLLPGDRRPVAVEPGLAAWPRIHVRLALVEDDDAAPVLSGVAGRSGPVVYVTARPGVRPPRALASSGDGRLVLVVPGASPGRRPLFTVAGCTGYAIRDARRGAA